MVRLSQKAIKKLTFLPSLANYQSRHLPTGSTMTFIFTTDNFTCLQSRVRHSLSKHCASFLVANKVPNSSQIIMRQSRRSLIAVTHLFPWPDSQHLGYSWATELVGRAQLHWTNCWESGLPKVSRSNVHWQWGHVLHVALGEERKVCLPPDSLGPQSHCNSTCPLATLRTVVGQSSRRASRSVHIVGPSQKRQVRGLDDPACNTLFKNDNLGKKGNRITITSSPYI